MIEIPRVYQHGFTYAPSTTRVNQTQSVSAESPPQVPIVDRRHKQDRRKRKQKIAIERRLAPSRRGPNFKAEV